MFRKVVLLGLLLMALGIAAKAASLPVLAIPQVSSAPSIDGQLGQNEWSNSAVTCGFRELGAGYPSKAKTVISVCYDNSSLYILYRCYGEDINKLVGASGAKDSPVWNDSEVEAFIIPQKWDGKYAHFMLNNAGAVADEMDSGSHDSSWNADWKCATGKSSDMWFAEVAIPWSSVDIAPKTDMEIRANFARNSAVISELSSWAPIAGSFHQPEYFGKLILAGKSTISAISDIPGRQITDGVVKSSNITSSDSKASCKMVSDLYGLNGKKTTNSVYGNELPVKVTYNTAGFDIKVLSEKGRIIWLQSVMVDLPDLPGRIQALKKSLTNLQKKSMVSESFASSVASNLNELQVRSQQTLDTDAVAKLSQDIDTVNCRISDIKRLHDSKNKDYFVTNPVSTLKVQLASPDPGPLANRLRIAMAKAEYEPLQIVVCPIISDLKGVRVTTSNLTGPNGTVIPAERIVVTPISSVNCKAATGGAKLKGRIPDILLPNRPMDVETGIRQPYFITVQTLASDAAGEYHGNVKIDIDNSSSTVLPLTVKVYNVTLPVKSYMRTAFCLWGSFGKYLDKSDPNAYMDTYIRYSRTMLAHRISPITMWSPKKDADGNWDFTDYDKYLSAVVPLGLTTLNIGGNGEVAGSQNTDFVKAARQHLKPRGWWDLEYVYGWDEAPGSAQNQLITNYKALVDAVPDVKIMQTGWSPLDKLKNLVKIWCPLTASADLKSCYAAQKAGDEVWWYVCCGPTAPYANLFVDYPGIDHRMLGWMTYKYGITGLLYWGVDVWPNNNDSIDSYDNANYTTWNPNSFGTVMGDGYLLYPGQGNTAVPSMRLALLRDGIEDYDLFKTAEIAANKAGASAGKIRSLLNINSKLIKSLTEYNQDGNSLLAYREKLLKAIDSIHK